MTFSGRRCASALFALPLQQTRTSNACIMRYVKTGMLIAKTITLGAAEADPIFNPANGHALTRRVQAHRIDLTWGGRYAFRCMASRNVSATIDSVGLA